MKYNEDIILALIEQFIRESYDKHYSTDGKGLQAMDIFRNLEIDKNFCQANAIKYLMRYGKKQGRNEEDLYKAIHYIVLLISSERKDKHEGITTGALYHPGRFPNKDKKE